ncbi:MAG: tripartite tricarboxylate transporter substrate-binding protein, partial [Betaproteobacteria bacterium]
MDNHYPKRIAPTRRYIIKQALLACAASVPGISLSQNSWPVDKRPIKIVVPYTPGGNVDIVARAIQTRMTAILGVPVIVDNKPGDSTAIGTIAVARSPADGHT